MIFISCITQINFKDSTPERSCVHDVAVLGVLGQSSDAGVRQPVIHWLPGLGKIHALEYAASRRSHVKDLRGSLIHLDHINIFRG